MLATPLFSWSRRGRPAATLALLGASLLTSGYSSCAGATGPLAVPLSILPNEVFLRASRTDGLVAVATARVEGGDVGDRFDTNVSYGKGPATNWLTVTVSGRNLTLRASPVGLDETTYVATVTMEEPFSGGKATLRVEFTVLR